MIPDRRLYANTISLQCTVPPAFEHVTLDQAKLHAKVDEDADDALITTMITAARLAAEGKTHRVLCESTWEWTTERTLAPWMEIPVSPCSECLSVSVNGEEIDADEYDFIPSGTGGASSPLYARLDIPLSGRSTISVTVKAGYPQGQCPEAIIQWMLVKISGWYDQRENFSMGTNVHEFSRGFVDHLLDPYILP